MALLDGHDGTSILFHLDGNSTWGRSEKLLGTTAGSSTHVTAVETDYNKLITNQLGAKMHIITWTNPAGYNRQIKLKAEQITAVIELCKTLQNEKINYKHIFLD